MRHELDKYFTLSQFAHELRVSIPRVTRLIEVLGIKTHPKAGAILADRTHIHEMKRALQDHLIKRGRKKGLKDRNLSAR